MLLDTSAVPIEAAQELRALLDAAVDAIVIIDANEKIVEFSAGAQRLFGHEPQTVIGRSVHLLMPEPHRTQHTEYVQRYLRTGRARIIGIGREVEALRADGSLIPVALSVGEVNTARGRFFVAILRDLSAQKRAEAEMRLAQNRLAHVGRFSLMGEMIAGIAHELNQPLAAIMTYAQAGRRMLGQSAGQVAELESICDRIAGQAQRASDVLARLRDFIRKQEVVKRPLDIAGVVNASLELIEADARMEGIVVRVRCTPDLPTVYGDVIQLQQVLINLTRNAVDAMKGSPGRALGIDIQVEPENDREGGVLISVIDHGAGIPAHLQESIFHPFVTTKADGLGVGLAISRTIINAHGGEISCQPNPDGGTIFKVFLPVADAGSA
jgi:two-component system sensor kinase FixL